MCGILGYIERKRPVDPDILRRMLETLSARGPDQSGTYIRGSVGLGHRRLSILDTSDAGRQPLRHEHGLQTIVFNGEIYNFSTLRGHFPNQKWRSHTDTEVLLHAYTVYGHSISSRLEGMFAFAVYNEETEEVYLARDRFGEKPLYYYLDDHLFCFASEVKALIAHPHIRERLVVDQRGMTKYLFYGYVPSPGTVWQSIHKLPPATHMTFDLRSWHLTRNERYWRLEDVSARSDFSSRGIMEELDQTINTAVRDRLISDVPLGIFLSGGVDSTVIAGYTARSATRPVNAFSIVVPGESGKREMAFAQRVAGDLGLTHHVYQINEHEVLETVQSACRYLDVPLADPALIPLSYLAKKAKPLITVALSGDGGDEIFAGYLKHAVQWYLERTQWVRWLLTQARPFAARFSSWEKLCATAERSFSARQFIMGTGSPLPADAARLLGVGHLDLDWIFAEAESYAALFPKKRDSINMSTFLDCMVLLPDGLLMKSDRATMAAGLELRAPFLDSRLATLMFSLPGPAKIRFTESKWWLKKIATQFTHPDVIYRRKHGFPVPIDRWIRHELRDLFAEYLFRDYGFFDQAATQMLFDEHVKGDRNHALILYRIWLFHFVYARICGNG